MYMLYTCTVGSIRTVNEITCYTHVHVLLDQYVQWMCSTHRGKSEGVPFEEGHRGDIDKHVLPSVSKETFAPHLNLDGLGRVLHDLDDDHLTQTAHTTHDSLDGVDDESTQQVYP